MSEDQFEIEFSQGAKVVFSSKDTGHLIKVNSISSDGEIIDEIHLNHNAKLRLIKWLINSIDV